MHPDTEHNRRPLGRFEKLGEVPSTFLGCFLFLVFVGMVPVGFGWCEQSAAALHCVSMCLLLVCNLWTNILLVNKCNPNPPFGLLFGPPFGPFLAIGIKGAFGPPFGLLFGPPFGPFLAIRIARADYPTINQYWVHSVLRKVMY